MLALGNLFWSRSCIVNTKSDLGSGLGPGISMVIQPGYAHFGFIFRESSRKSVEVN